MTLPRKSLVSLDDTPFYHCVSRCVRRAYLCGNDRYSRKSYEHRRDWLEVKLWSVSDIFAIKLCAYAVMSNHYHVVLHVRVDQANDWSERDVVERWHRLFNGTVFSQRFWRVSHYRKQSGACYTARSKSGGNACVISLGLCASSMNPLHDKLMRKITALVVFGRGALKVKPFWMNEPYSRVWPMST